MCARSKQSDRSDKLDRCQDEQASWISFGFSMSFFCNFGLYFLKGDFIRWLKISESHVFVLTLWGKQCQREAGVCFYCLFNLILWNGSKVFLQRGRLSIYRKSFGCSMSVWQYDILYTRSFLHAAWLTYVEMQNEGGCQSDLYSCLCIHLPSAEGKPWEFVGRFTRLIKKSWNVARLARHKQKISRHVLLHCHLVNMLPAKVSIKFSIVSHGQRNFKDHWRVKGAIGLEPTHGPCFQTSRSREQRANCIILVKHFKGQIVMGNRRSGSYPWRVCVFFRLALHAS